MSYLYKRESLTVMDAFGNGYNAQEEAMRKYREQNDAILNRWLNHWSQTSGIELWCGWGVNGARLDRAQVVFEAIQRLLPERRRLVPDSPHPLMLGRTASGQPRHPLYSPRNACLRPFLWADPEPIRHPVRTLTEDLPS